MKLLTALLLICSVVANAGPETGDEKLRVFLQGAPAAELRALVEEHGGSVTHDLPIIDAIGATLTRPQLERVLESPMIARYFDDLALNRDDREGADESSLCDVGGGLELAIKPSSISWRLFNKRDQPATLTRLEMRWPEKLGHISSIELEGRQIDIQRQTTSTTPLVIELPEEADDSVPSLSGTGLLEIAFEGPRPGNAGPFTRQSDFYLKADFDPDCSVELVPAYADNHENFYYNSVAGVDALHQHGVTGKGVTVAVIDSGLWEHPNLARDTAGRQRVVARYDAIKNTRAEEVFDDSGHGTHMTSIIAHSGPTTKQGEPTGSFKGVAPDVDLIAVKAFDVAGQGDFLDIVRAVQWVVDNQKPYNIKVLNLSFSARPRWPYWLDPINQAIMRAWAAGITVVAAAGNEGPEPMTIGSPGNLPYIITVGAVTDSWTPETRDDDYIPDFSSRGPTPSAHIKPDIVAPGGHITGVTRPGSGLTRKHPEYLLNSGEFVMTGSSQASALVSGIAALLLQLEPELTPDDIKCKLISSAEPAINADGLLAYSPFVQGHGYVNAARAITLGQRKCGNAELDLQQELSGEGHFTGPAIVEEDGSVGLPGLSRLVSPEPAIKGHSASRKWGVKEHIERSDDDTNTALDSTVGHSPFDWMEVYLEEKAIIEDLSRDSPDS